MRTTSTSTDLVREPSELALDRASKAVRRARTNAQIRLTFIARTQPEDPTPPLASMLRGGRGGHVRLKLYLSFLWMQTRDYGVPLAYPAQLWAQLLDLPQPETAGARRIHQAQAWLERRKFITVEAQPGHPNRVTVLDETGNGRSYVTPGAAVNALRQKPEASRHRYVQVPSSLWTNGYMASLSGAGVALFLVLLAQRDVRTPFEDLRPIWVSPSVLKARYGLSDDTRTKGIRDLRDHGLVTVSRQVVNPEDFDLERVRNVYTIHAAALEYRARVPASY